MPPQKACIARSMITIPPRSRPKVFHKKSLLKGRVDGNPLTSAAARARRGALRRTRCASLSPLRLWQIRKLSGEETPVRIYPDFRALAKYTLLATDNRLSQIGVLQVRRRGEGTEFHQLREYRQGDPQRAIDWKATARTARLVAREYEEERDQRVAAGDRCGRAGRQGDALSPLDHTNNAVAPQPRRLPRAMPSAC